MNRTINHSTNNAIGNIAEKDKFKNTRHVANYNHYGTWLKKRFNGAKVYKITVDGGFTCPNIDGTKAHGGCTYCNTRSFTPSLSNRIYSLQQQILNQKEILKKVYQAEKFIIYFQPNSNTYGSLSELKVLYEEALAVIPDQTVGLSIGTRCDCLDEEKINYLDELGKKLHVSLEIGTESIYNKTLKKINRQHTVEDLLNTMEMLKKRSIKICTHFIFGFPWESQDQQLKYAEFANQLPIHFIKLHQLHINKGTKMALAYKKSSFSLYSLEQYLYFLADFLPLLKKDIIIQRLFAISPSHLLLAPKWGLTKFQLQGKIEQFLMKNNITQGSKL